MINPDDYDVFFLTRSDLTDEQKHEILGLKIEQSRKQIAAGNFYTAEQIDEEIEGWFQESLANQNYKYAS